MFLQQSYVSDYIVLEENNDVFEYDVLGRLTKYNDTDYTYDVNGNILKESELTETLREFRYGNDNRLNRFNTNTMTVDKDGNLLSIPLSDGIEQAVYDSRNILISLGDLEYSCNDEDIRNSLIDDGEEVRYVVDVHSSQLSRVLMETDEEGSLLNYMVIYHIGDPLRT